MKGYLQLDLLMKHSPRQVDSILNLSTPDFAASVRTILTVRKIVHASLRDFRRIDRHSHQFAVNRMDRNSSRDRRIDTNSIHFNKIQFGASTVTQCVKQADRLIHSPLTGSRSINLNKRVTKKNP